jgi:hypothetical protein
VEGWRNPRGRERVEEVVEMGERPKLQGETRKARKRKRR